MPRRASRPYHADNVLLAYCIYYIYGSFNNHLPWMQWEDDEVDDCEDDWDDDSCSPSTGRYWDKRVLRQSRTIGSAHAYELHGWLALALIVSWLLVYLSCVSHPRAPTRPSGRSIGCMVRSLERWPAPAQ